MLDVEDYLEKANKEWKDENYYKRISDDPIHEHMKIVNFIIETFHRQQVLAKNIADNLKTTNIKAPHFYVTPRLNKKDIPGQPVVSSIDCHTSKLFKFFDHYLSTPRKSSTYLR